MKRWNSGSLVLAPLKKCRTVRSLCTWLCDVTDMHATLYSPAAVVVQISRARLLPVGAHIDVLTCDETFQSKVEDSQCQHT